LAANVLCLFFTYERTFWAAAALGCVFVAARSKPEARRRALKWVPALGASLILVLAAVAPNDLITALERGASVSEVKSDESGRYRVVESQHVLDEIRARPAEGSGFGAEITWEPPEFRGTELTTGFSHNGYLWLAWKAGLPFLLVCVAILVSCFMRRGSAVNDSLMGVLRLGAQASLMALLVINITFPSFNFLSIAVVTGFLAAFCWFPRRMP
jgi:hypothetical protein